MKSDSMRILFYLGHPAHFHLFKHSMKRLQANGHSIKVVIKTKDILEELLQREHIGYENILAEGRKDTKFGMLMGVLKRDWRLAKLVGSNRVDMLIGSEPSVAHAGKLYGIPSLIFVEDDTHIIPYFARLTYPFTRNIVSPVSCDIGKWSHKKIEYRGYQKLAYLHPNVFRPDPTRVDGLNGVRGRIFLLRLSKLSAHHDFGVRGMDKGLLRRVIELLSKHGRVFISAEQHLDPEFEAYRLAIDVRDMHHFLSRCDLFLGDSQSMAVEAAILGTPGIRFSDFAGRIGVLEELEHKYGLTCGIKTSQPERLFATLEDLLRMPNLKDEWQKRRRAMLSEKIDVTAFMVWLIENYPDSARVMRTDPDYQLRFTKTRLRETASGALAAA